MVETDDWIEPETFECLYAAAYKEKIDVVEADFYNYYTKPETRNVRCDNLHNCPYEKKSHRKQTFLPFL
jgi:hypothetical protein